VPKCQTLARDVLRVHQNELTDDLWLSLGERLLATGWFEEGTVGLHIVELLNLPAAESLITTYERSLGTYIGNWAHCDKLCTGLIGPILVDLPLLVERIEGWTASPNRWVRRGAAVSLVIPARSGLFVDESLRIAEALLGDGDDLVQKDFGWMLREQADTRRPQVAAFLERHVQRVPRTAFRYAIEKFPPSERKRMMAL